MNFVLNKTKQTKIILTDDLKKKKNTENCTNNM